MWICFACILSIFFDHDSHYETPLTFTISLSGYVAAIITIAIALGLFIYSLLNMREFEQIKKQNFDLTEERKKLEFTIKLFHQNNDKYVVFASILAVLSIIGPMINWFSNFSGSSIGFIITWGITFIIFSGASYLFTFYLFQRKYLSTLIKHKKHLPIKLHRLFVYGSWIYVFCVLGIFYITTRLPYDLYIPFFNPTLFIDFSIIVYCLFTYFFIKEKAE